MSMFSNLIRALRLPFITASVLPFIFGSLIVRNNFNLWGFTYGLIAVIATHLSANLINDYADSKSGADEQDKNYYSLFGGSKLIQEGVYTAKFYLKLAIFFGLLSFFSVLLLALNLKDLSAAAFYFIIIICSWLYSHKPLQFSYHKTGEFFIFLLFGPALVMGGYFIQTKIFPSFNSFLLSLPFGFFTAAILFANEVPDFLEDKKAGKFTWVSICGREKAYIIYFLLACLAFISIIINVTLGYLKPLGLFSLIFIFPAIRAAIILKKYHANKIRLVESSRLTIAMQALVSLILIAGVL